MKKQIVGRILILLFNLAMVATLIMLIMDKEWGGLVVVTPLAVASFYLEIDELIHPDKYSWD
jgi:hypothetical protein